MERIKCDFMLQSFFVYIKAVSSEIVEETEVLREKSQTFGKQTFLHWVLTQVGFVPRLEVVRSAVTIETCQKLYVKAIE